MGEDPTIPDQELTHFLTDVGAGTDDDDDGGRPRGLLFALLSIAAIAIGVIVGATIALAGDDSNSNAPMTATSGAGLVITTPTSLPAVAPVVTDPPPETLPPTTVAATVPVTAPPTTTATTPTPSTTGVIVTAPTTAAPPTATTTPP